MTTAQQIDNSPVDMDQIMDAVMRDDYTGICLACGSEQGNCEPDARRYTCEDCGEKRVFGAEELMFLFA